MSPSSLPVPVPPPTLARTAGVCQVAISVDGRYVATTDTELNLRVARDGERIWSHRLSPAAACRMSSAQAMQRVRGLVFDEFSQSIVVAFNDKVLALDLETAKPIWEYQPPRSFGFLVVTPLSLTAGNGRIAASFDNGTVVQWSVDGKIMGLWQANDAPRMLSIVGDEIVGTDSFSLTRWSMGTRHRKARFRMPERVYGFAAHPLAPVAATRTLHYVYLWNLDTGRSIARMTTGTGLPLVTFHPRDPLVLIPGPGYVDVHEFDGSLRHRFELGDEKPMSVTLAPSGEYFLVGMTSEKLNRFDWFGASGRVDYSV